MKQWLEPSIFSFLMWSFAHRQPRTTPRLLAPLCAGLLVPMLVTAAPAQNSPHALLIAPARSMSNATEPMAPRAEREQLAEAVMAPSAPETTQTKTTVNQLAFDEAVKRLRAAETSEPRWALEQYKRFFDECTLAPALGVQVGLKIAQLRLKWGDAEGALQTCEVIAQKYAGEPSAVLLELQKSRVLLERARWAEAAECVSAVVPELVALGPSHYVEISDVLLQLVQALLDEGETAQAQALCVDLEVVYLRWMKRDTVDHLWQRFEVLQAHYQGAGDAKRAAELMPKVADALLKTPVEPGFTEGAVLSLEAARWLNEHDSPDEAAVFYARIPEFGDSWHSGLALYDQGLRLVERGEHEAARALLLRPVSGPRADEIKIGLLSLLSSSYLATGDNALARQSAQQALDLNGALAHAPQDEGFKYQAQRAREVLAQTGLAGNAGVPKAPGA